MKKTFIFLSLLSFSCYCLPEPDFSSILNEKDPGEGTLTYTHGKEAEKVVFGKKYRAVALEFNGNHLPSLYFPQFEKKDIFQIMFQAFDEKGQSSFGGITLVSLGHMVGRTVFEVMLKSKKKVEADSAMLMFASPLITTPLTDEDRLKRTYFGKSGSIIAEPIDVAAKITFRSGDKKAKRVYELDRRHYGIEIRSVLSTPFVAQENKLEGKIIVPVFRPSNSTASELVIALIRKSLGQL